MDSPYKRATDSPSRQLLFELGRLRVDADEDFHARLERETCEREKAHKAALAAAAIEHERVRRSAEVAAERFQLELEKARRKTEDEERRELDKKRQEKLERELAERRKEIERAKTAEVEERRAAEARRAQLEAVEKLELEREKQEAELRHRKEELERVRRKVQEDATIAREAKVVEARRPKEPVQLPRPVTVQAPLKPSEPLGSISQADPSREAEHQTYQVIHQRLKEMRRFMMAQGKSNPGLKKRMGDMRRDIKKCVGQLTEGKGANRGPINQIMKVLREAVASPHPRIEIPQFLAHPPPSTTTDSETDTTGPALLIYLLNIFSKAIVSQFIDEAGVSPKAADPIGVVAVSVFAATEFRWKGLSLIDMMIAKYHVVCPVLWGIHGDEKSNQGKTRLGWWREEKGGPWVSEQRHSERMTGLGAGFAAIALRNFEKSRLESPYPNVHYWESLAAIVNVPAQMATQTHFIVLKAMIENYGTRFLELYGDAAKIALRKALIDFPREVKDKSVAASAVAVLPDVLRRDKKLTLVD